MIEHETGIAAPRVRRRRVFYVSGYDPQGPRRYHQVYKAEGPKQAAISGYELEVSALSYEPGGRAASWTAALTDGGRTEAEITMLRWDDISRAWMRKPMGEVYRLMAVTWWRYVGSGAFHALTGLRRISTWVGMYPVAMLILYLLLSVAAGLLVMDVAAALTGWPVWVMAPLGLLVAALLMRLGRRIDDYTLVYYLMCDFGFTAAHSDGEAPEIEARVDDFAARVHDAWAEGECDEVLIIGHSSGASYAAGVAARAIALGADKRTGPQLSLLTIGQTIPMLSFLPGANRMREELALLGRSEAIDWVDVTSLADGGCYALADPVAVSGAAPPRAERRNPKVISAAFWNALSPEMKKEIRWRWFRVHIQYLCAFDRVQDYDYFAITAGALTLPARFAARRETPQIKGAPMIQRRLRAQ